MKKGSKLLLISAVIGLSVALLFAVFFGLVLEPDIRILGFEQLDESKIASANRTITFYDNEQSVISDALYDSNKIYVDISQIPAHTKNAFIAIEDKRFYKHRGIDYVRVFSALKTNILKFKFKEGASTITQQLIKNTHLSNEKTIKRKIQEMRLSRKLERKRGKDEILEGYLNILYFGNNIYGIGTASRIMFNKPANELNCAESAALAAIINNPAKYSPYKNPEAVLQRQKTVLKLMHKGKLITTSEYEDALATKIEFNIQKRHNQYIDDVINEAATVLNCSHNDLFYNNYSFKTFYNADFTQKIDKILEDAVADEPNAAARVIVLDNNTRRIVSDVCTLNKGVYNLKRQPASTLKPFLCYAHAFENGTLYPCSPLNDSKTDFDGYCPSNYKNIYLGWAPARECLIKSQNVTAVKILLDNGVENCLNTAKKFGLKFDSADNTAAVALGGLRYGVTLTSLADAYMALANNGNFAKSGCIDYILDGNMNVVYKSRIDSRRAVSAETAYMLNNILSDCVKNGTASKLKHLKYVAAKTGTNGNKDGNTDGYCIAYTPDHTVAVWVGAVNDKLPNHITGGSFAAKIAAHTIEKCGIEGKEDFNVPRGIVHREIDITHYNEQHEVVLADYVLPQRYRKNEMFNINHLPKRKPMSLIDYYDKSRYQGNNFYIVDGISY